MVATMAKKKTNTDRHLPYRHIRLPLELYQRLQELAVRMARPLSWEVRKALEKHLDEYKDKRAE